MTSTELFKLVSKQWADINDIKKIASCGRDTATKIRDNIICEISKSKKYLPTSRSKIVPMTYVIDYLNLDIEHISTMAINENKLKDRKE